MLYDWWPIVDERRHIGRILETPVSTHSEAETVSAGGGGDAPTPRTRMNSPTLSGVSSPTT